MKFLLIGLVGAVMRTSEDQSNVDLGNLLVAGSMIAAVNSGGGG